MGIGRSKQQATVLCVGLDGAGKSTMINYLKPPARKNDEIAPTVGLSTEMVKYSGIHFTIQDMSGAAKYRSLWKECLDQVQGIIFVIDSADDMRFSVVQSELMELLEAAPQNVPIIFCANKSDLAGALTAEELAVQLTLNRLCADRAWSIVATNALTGAGVEESMNWLTQHIPKKKK